MSCQLLLLCIHLWRKFPIIYWQPFSLKYLSKLRHEFPSMISIDEIFISCNVQTCIKLKLMRHVIRTNHLYHLIKLFVLNITKLLHFLIMTIFQSLSVTKVLIFLLYLRTCGWLNQLSDSIIRIHISISYIDNTRIK